MAIAAKMNGFSLSHSVAAYDHGDAPMLGDVIALDFINSTLEPETAKERLAAAHLPAEFEPAEMRVRRSTRCLT